MSLYVVFDTSALKKNHNPKSMDWVLFREWRQLMGASVYVPEVVHFETKKNILDNQIERIDNILTGAFDRFDHWDLVIFSAFNNQCEKDQLRTQLVSECESRIDNELDKLYLELFGILPIRGKCPEISHGRLLEKYYLGKRKPYEGKKQSYQDTILWESILELLRDGVEKVIFVSSNYTDFGAGEKTTEKQRAEFLSNVMF